MFDNESLLVLTVDDAVNYVLSCQAVIRRERQEERER
jgi:hypothetical protein